MAVSRTRRQVRLSRALGIAHAVEAGAECGMDRDRIGRQRGRRLETLARALPVLAGLCNT